MEQNIELDDLDEETRTRLNGDKLGDTMYSSGFIVRTLLQLQNLQWSDNLEVDLCTLWDMTTEKEVADFLFSFGFPAVASHILETEENNRLFEIILGILANIYSLRMEREVTENECDAIANIFLHSQDEYVLCQVMRCFSTLNYSRVGLAVGPRCMRRFELILRTCECIELASHTLDAIAKTTSSCRIEKESISTEMASATFIALRPITRKTLDCYEDVNVKRCFMNLMQIFLNISSYCEGDPHFENKFRQHSREYVTDFAVIVNFCSESEELTEHEIKFVVEASGFLCPLLEWHSTDICHDFFVIYEQIEYIKPLKYDDKFANTFYDLLSYFISVDDLKPDKYLPRRCATTLMQMYKMNLKSDHNYQSKLRDYLIKIELLKEDDMETPGTSGSN